MILLPYYFAFAQWAGGIYVFALSVRPSVRPSICPSVHQYGIFSAAITNEPPGGISKNCRNILSTLIWRAELIFRGCVMQDGRLRAMFIQNPYRSITLYWSEILTSIVLLYSWCDPQIVEGTGNCQKWQCLCDTHIPHFKKNYIPEITIKTLKLPEIAENYQTLPKLSAMVPGSLFFTFVSVKNS